ncbi:uncharacterized protein LOC144579870 [Callithrix jacchus]
MCLISEEPQRIAQVSQNETETSEGIIKTPGVKATEFQDPVLWITFRKSLITDKAPFQVRFGKPYVFTHTKVCTEIFTTNVLMMPRRAPAHAAACAPSPQRCRAAPRTRGSPRPP